MASARIVPPDLKTFTSLPAQQFTIDQGDEWMAVSTVGRALVGRLPVVCVAGYQRNMSDYSDFVGGFRRLTADEHPVVLVDLKGRGRSSDRRDRTRYVSTIDAGDLQQVCAALAIEQAVFIGQGYGGQVVLAMAAAHPRLVAGAVLIDAGPVSDPRGLVRLRNNLNHLDGTRSEAGLRAVFRRILNTEYPTVPDGLLDLLASRTHYIDKRGRVTALFDAHLIKLLEGFEHDDLLVPQWQMFDALAHVPLLLMRTQLTDQVRREVFDEMRRRRRDVEAYLIDNQGSPALLNTPDDVAPIAEFMQRVLLFRNRPPATAQPVTA